MTEFKIKLSNFLIVLIHFQNQVSLHFIFKIKKQEKVVPSPAHLVLVLLYNDSCTLYQAVIFKVFTLLLFTRDLIGLKSQI